MPLPSKKGDRIYFGWGSGGNGIGQITDIVKLIGKEADWPIPPTPANLNAPVLGTIMFPSNWGIHTFYELKEVYLPDFALGQVEADATRDFAILVSEAGGFKCSNERDITFIYEITNPAKPVAASTYQVPAASGNFCEKGGRFGPHSGQDRYDGPFYKKLYVLAYFNAGVRVVDIRNPFQPKEIGYFVPSAPERIVDQRPNPAKVIQSCDVFVDSNGIMYLTDTNAGLGAYYRVQVIP